MTGKRIASIIMAGGKGTRMGVADKHKATFEVAGVPTITRLLDSLAKVDITFNVIVVGVFAEQLMNVVAKTSYAPLYAFQAIQKGTGNAAKMGLYALEQSGFDGDVLIVPGDAFINPAALKNLIEMYTKSRSDMAILVMDKQHAPDFGHIVQGEDGTVVGSIEYWDLIKGILTKKVLGMVESLEKNKAEAETGSSEKIIAQIKDLLEHDLKEEKRIAKVFPTIYQAIKDCEKASMAGNVGDVYKNTLRSIQDALKKSPTGFLIKGVVHDAEAILRGAKYVNVSIYLCSARTWYEYIERITSNNTQNEEYLTDILQILVDAGKKIVAVPLSSPNDVMSFNTTKELQKINEDFLASKHGSK